MKKRFFSNVVARWAIGASALMLASLAFSQNANNDAKVTGWEFVPFSDLEKEYIGKKTGIPIREDAKKWAIQAGEYRCVIFPVIMEAHGQLMLIASVGSIETKEGVKATVDLFTKVCLGPIRDLPDKDLSREVLSHFQATDA